MSPSSTPILLLLDMNGTIVREQLLLAPLCKNTFVPLTQNIPCDYWCLQCYRTDIAVPGARADLYLRLKVLQLYSCPDNKDPWGICVSKHSAKMMVIHSL